MKHAKSQGGASRSLLRRVKLHMRAVNAKQRWHVESSFKSRGLQIVSVKVTCNTKDGVGVQCVSYWRRGGVA